jgi:hypothetical protein
MTTPFINNKYTLWYFNIIQSARNSPLPDIKERHHILPKSLGGSNDKTNIVTLSPRQHYICHQLLIKMTVGQDKNKMVYAFWIMANRTKLKKSNSKIYLESKKIIKNQMSSRIITDEFREKCRQRQLGKPMLPQTKLGLLKANTGKNLSDEVKEKIQYTAKKYYKNNPNTRKGQKRTDEQKQRISEGRKQSWANNPNQGRTTTN